MSDTVQLVKEKLSIQDVVSPYVKLTRAGKYWKGLSPFTKEKTPSFFVSPDRGLYHCFSTGKGGDMFTFVQEMEGVDFKGALKLLADKAGVPLVYDKSAQDDREKLYEALSGAQRFFIEERKKTKEIDTYLISRGLKAEAIEAWGIGYAPAEWQALHGYLTAQGSVEGILERAGLIKKPDQGEEKAPRYYDRFRGRIMFPIKDISGRIVGFSGRIFKDDPVHPQAKYLNSPETPVFDKSRALYGIDVAREGIRNLGSALLVEGQLDLLMSHQAGYKNAVATSGTSFTEGHAELIKRYTPNLLIAYDGDRAGIAAAGRAAGIALSVGMNVKVAKLPLGEDPADMLKVKPEAFKTAVREALHVVDFYIAHIQDAGYDPRAFRLEVSRTVLPYVAMVQNKIDQAHFMERVAQTLSVPVEAVKAELLKLKPKEAFKPDVPGVSASPFLSRTDTVERLVFGLMLLSDEGKDEEESNRARSVLKDSVGEARLKELEDDADAKRAALFEADLFLSGREGAMRASAILDLYADLAREARHEEYRSTVAALREAEKAGDEVAQGTLMGKLSSLARSLE